MKKMSLKEFKTYCECKNFTSYIYTTENQRNKHKEYTDITLTFSYLYINLFPKMLLFTNNANTMQINCVQEIIVDETCVIGDIITIICGYNDEKTQRKAYVLIAK